jgi:hypothetical protein
VCAFDQDRTSVVPARATKDAICIASPPRLVRKVLDGPERPPRA